MGEDLSNTVVGRLSVVLGLENKFNTAKGGTSLKSEHYIALKAAGVCTVKIDRNSGFAIQSDLTAKPESENTDECNANHRFMWNYIGDSLADIARPYVNTLMRPNSRTGLVEAIRSFLSILKSEGDRSLARIDTYTCEDVSSDPWKGLGHADIAIDVQMLRTQKYINLRLMLTTQVIVNAA